MKPHIPDTLRIPGKPDLPPVAAGFSEDGNWLAGRSRSEIVAAARIIGFLCLILVCLVVAHYVINTGLRRIQTSSFGVSNKVFNGEVNAEVVIVGSSRAMVHYDPRIIQAATGRTAFNLGLNGSQTDMQVALFKAYLTHNAKPELVVFNLDLFSFVTSREIVDPVQYMPYLNEDSLYTAIRRVYPDAWKWKYLPLYGYAVQDMRFNWIVGMKGFFGLEPSEDRVLGYVPRHMTWTGDFEQFRKEHPDGVRFEIEIEGVLFLEELVQLCRQRGILVLFVYSPEYYEMQELERNRSEIFSKFQEIGTRYGVPLWDYSHSPLSQSRANFYNSQHLNAKGAAAFSTVFARQLANSRLLEALATSPLNHP